MKNYLRTQITLYEEDKNYPIWRRQERRSKYAVQLASWQLRSNSPKMSVCGQNRVRSVSSTILIGSISYLHMLSSNFRRCVACNARFKIQKFGEFFKFVTLTLSSFDLLFLVSFLHCHCSLQFRMDSFHIWYKWSIAWEGVSHVMTFDLDLYLQGHSALT